MNRRLRCRIYLLNCRFSYLFSYLFSCHLSRRMAASALGASCLKRDAEIPALRF